ncbi:MAG TPA: hypothetical protein VI542_30925, partial [Candidatus Tectomicrobia bacterium]
LPLDAFQHACFVIMRDEEFFPKPVQFRAYAREWQQKCRHTLQQQRGTQDTLAVRETLVSPEEVRALIATIWPEENNGRRREPKPKHTAQDALDYEPSVDPEVAKAKLREQFRQLQAQEGASSC